MWGTVVLCRHIYEARNGTCVIGTIGIPGASVGGVECGGMLCSVQQEHLRSTKWYSIYLCNRDNWHTKCSCWGC